MCSSGYESKLSVLYAVLSLAAGLTILVFSVLPVLSPGAGMSANSGMPVLSTEAGISPNFGVPALSLGGGISANSGMIPHGIAYAILCFLICMWLRFAGTTQAPIVCAFFVSAMYGFFVECIQFGLPYRSFEMGDILLNCSAAAIATLPCYVAIRYVQLYRT